MAIDDSIVDTTWLCLRNNISTFLMKKVISVYTINLKVLLQGLCIEKWGWDKELTGEKREKYEHVVSELSRVDGIHM